MDSKEFLSNVVVYSKYAKYNNSLQRRENWSEIIQRNADMHAKRYPQIADEIYDVYANYVIPKKVFPSMRSLQFAGKAIEVTPNRIFNCAFSAADHPAIFSETMFNLLGGCGVGISVQKHQVSELPPIKKPSNKRHKRYLIPDSIEGWAEAIKVLMKSYFKGSSRVVFDYSDIRAKGTELVTAGGLAPGPAPLKGCIDVLSEKMDRILEDNHGVAYLSPIQVHDIICFISDAVLAGGIRRSALISLFSIDDEEMLTSKGNFKFETTMAPRIEGYNVILEGSYNGVRKEVIIGKEQYEEYQKTGTLPWYIFEEQRGRANNSVVLEYDTVTREDFDRIWQRVEDSGAGEPGVYWTNDRDLGSNPCCLSGDARLLTDDGYKSFSELNDAQENTLNLINKYGEVVDGSVWSTGIQEVFEIKAGRTSNPIAIKATADHIFETSDGESVRVDELYHKRLRPYYIPKILTNELDAKYGFILGDGSFRYDSSDFKNIQCSFTAGKDDEVSSLFRRTGWTDDTMTYTVDVSYEELQAFGVDTSKKTYERVLPTDASNEFLTGLYSANGCVIANGRVSYKTTSVALRDGILLKLQNMGIDDAYYTTNKATSNVWDNGTYVSRESYDVNIGSLKSLIVFAEKINFIQTYKREALDRIITNKSPFVFSVKSVGYEKVYDFNLDDDTHWGVVDGVVVHNCEISLKSNGYCNLTEVIADGINTQEEYNNRARAAAFLGTLQAGYTNFHYLRSEWQDNAEDEALLGVSMTGIASGDVLRLDMVEAAKCAADENARVANLININPGKRITTVKPSGTASLVAGTSSGIHAWHAPYYIRRMRLNKDEAIYKYLVERLPSTFIEDDVFSPNTTAVLAIPVKSPEDAIFRDESPIDLMERVKKVHDEWIANEFTHREGVNTHNVSVTVSIDKGQWGDVGNWMWDNRHSYHGISVLPLDAGTYLQMPFTDSTKEEYEDLIAQLDACGDINLDDIHEERDTTDLSGEAACSGGACEVSSL